MVPLDIVENEMENPHVEMNLLNHTDKDIKIVSYSKTKTFGKYVGSLCFVLILAATALITIGLEFSVGKFCWVDLKSYIVSKIY